MAEVKILIPGYYNRKTGIFWSTVTLIKDKNLTMIADPGTIDQDKIITSLKDERLSVNDIDTVCITHSHLDHYRNIGMFPYAKSIDYWGRWTGTKFIHYKSDRKISDDIYLIRTPGHSFDGISLLVSTSSGIIAICGDLFWDESGPEVDEFATDTILLKKNRIRITESADWIIPGHGDIFKVKK